MAVFWKTKMLIITECRFCNADKNTCQIKLALSAKLRHGGIKETLRYRCSSWKGFLKYKIGDKVDFHFIEYSLESNTGWELSGDTLVGEIVGINKKKAIYEVKIDKENRNKIDGEYTTYEKYLMPVDFLEEEPTAFVVPVKEEFITGLV